MRITTKEGMDPVYAPERHHAIVETARADGRVEVVALAATLGVTPETVRRDLTILEQRGLIRRVHGGAIPVDRLELEPTVSNRRTRASAEKRRIAERAVKELPAEGTVLLDSGTTTQLIAELLPADRSITVVTNSVNVAALLQSHPSVSLYVLGGRVRRRTGAAVGEWLSEALKEVCVDVAFMGANGFSVHRGMTTPDQIEAAAKRAMVQAARRVVVVADSSKAGQDHFHRFARPEEVSLLITDDGLDADVANGFSEAGTDVAMV